ncbi:MAG TPA: GNAT family N-acetyltransferase [Ramlibacter sp.]|nr:GNAT family N-acetyltransferase [Ramlibacter sp.]
MSTSSPSSHPAPAGVAIRPIRPDDLARELAFVQGLSRRTGYQRLMSSRRLTMAELRRFTTIDPEHEAALVAVADHGRRQVGVARYVEQETGEAEFALVLADDWQGRGLGRVLLEQLIDTARAHGLRALVGTTFSQNVPMLALARKLGFRTRRVPGNAIETELRLDLAEEGGQATLH